MNFKEFLGRLTTYIKPHLLKLVFTGITMIIATALEASIPEITGQIVDKLFLDNRSINDTVFYSILFIAIFTLSSIFNLISASASSWVSNKVIMDLRIDLFSKLLKLPKKYFDINKSGKTLSKFIYDVEQISSLTSTIWINLIKSSLTVVILVGYLFYKNWQLSLILIFILPIIFIVVRNATSRMRSASINLQESMGDISQILNENIDGQSIVKMYLAERREREKFIQNANHLRQQKFKLDFTSAYNSNFINTLLGLCLGVIIYFSSTNQSMSGGEFLSFFTALAILIKPAKTLVDINKPIQIGYAAGKSVFNFIDEENEIDSKETKKPSNVYGNISFKEVSFAYDKKNNVLKNVSFEISKGQTVAIVGPTGSGKTTIFEILCKFYPLDHGSVFLDDLKLDQIPNDYLRSKIAYVDQNSFLFNETISNNILFGANKIANKNHLNNIARKAHAFDFIQQLESKFETIVGDNGKLLSGGQKQRIAIARAMAKNSPILLLDEATSALDSKTEKLIQQAIDNMKSGKTTLIIAHRLSTVQNADLILVLKEGQIIEKGNHNELMALNGFYSNLVKDQFN